MNNIHPRIQAIIGIESLCPACNEPLNLSESIYSNQTKDFTINCSNYVSSFSHLKPDILCPIYFQIYKNELILLKISDYNITLNYKENMICYYSEIRFILNNIDAPPNVIHSIPNNISFKEKDLEQKLKLWLTFS